MSNRRLVDILHEITGELSAYRDLSYPHAPHGLRAGDLTLLRRSGSPGDAIGTVAAAHEDANVHDLSVQLEHYPEIRAALDPGRPVLVEDVSEPPAVHQHPRGVGARRT